MPIIQIADKPTLDSVKTTVEGTSTDVITLKGRGGIKYNSTTSKPQIYDTANSIWVDLEVGGGSGTPILTIKNENMGMTGDSITVTHESGLFTTTKTMPDASSLSIEVPYLGNYSVKYPNTAGAIKTVYVEVVGVGNTMIIPSTIVSPFSTATWDEIESMCQAYYDGTISDLSTYWSIGDTKIMHLNDIQAPNPGSGLWTAQDIAVTLVAFNHTDLATAINGHTKAAITVQTRETISASGTSQGTIYVNGDSSYDTSFTKWSNLYMRTYLNNKVYNGFPNEVKTIIKPSKHYRHTTYNGTASEQVTDNLFLPSYPEIFGTASYDYYVATSPTEGTQFPYYETASNRIKYNNNNGASGGSAQYYWMGSASSNYNSSYGYFWCGVHTSGSASSYIGNSAYGLAPAFAI